MCFWIPGSLISFAPRNDSVQTCVIARIRGGAGRRLPLFPPSPCGLRRTSRPLENEGMERRKACPYFRLAASSFEGCGRLSALHRGVLRQPGPRFLLVHFGPAFGSGRKAPFGWPLPLSLGQAGNGLPSASSSRGVIMPPGEPGAARELGGHVHPPPAGAASGSILETSREDALVEPDHYRITYLGNMVKRAWELFLGATSSYPLPLVGEGKVRPRNPSAAARYNRARSAAARFRRSACAILRECGARAARRSRPAP
jgi:hypothetical protein